MHHNLLIFYKGKIILRGTRTTKLWNIDKHQPATHLLNTTIGNPTIAERIAFYHASLFSPTLITLSNAIKAGYLTTFPAFTAKKVNKYPPSLAATHKDHMKSQKQNLRSTQAHSASNLEQLKPSTPETALHPHLIKHYNEPPATLISTPSPIIPQKKQQPYRNSSTTTLDQCFNQLLFKPTS